MQATKVETVVRISSKTTEESSPNNSTSGDNADSEKESTASALSKMDQGMEKTVDRIVTPDDNVFVLSNPRYICMHESMHSPCTARCSWCKQR